MELTERVLALLNQSEPMKSGEIAKALGVDKKELDVVIRKLKDNEKIDSPKRCFYTIKK